MRGKEWRRLVVDCITRIAIPTGVPDPLMAGVEFLSSADRLSSAARQAQEEAAFMVCAVRNAKEPNPWKGATDEQIAAEIMAKLDAKRKGAKL